MGNRQSTRMKLTSVLVLCLIASALTVNLAPGVTRKAKDLAQGNNIQTHRTMSKALANSREEGREQLAESKYYRRRKRSRSGNRRSKYARGYSTFTRYFGKRKWGR